MPIISISTSGSSRTLRAAGRPEPSDFGLTEVGYNCMAQYIARAIAVGLYAKPPNGPISQTR